MHELSFSFQYGRSPHTSWGIPTSPYFNSRPCVREPVYSGDTVAAQVISIHTPTRGRYAGRPCRPRFLPDFNSRPCAKGDGRPALNKRPSLSYFNSRPCMRGDMNDTATTTRISRFQFTPLREGRQQNQTNNHICFVAKLLNIKYSFSSTARMGKKASISRPCSSVFLRLPPSIFCIGMVGAPSQ